MNGHQLPLSEIMNPPPMPVPDLASLPAHPETVEVNDLDQFVKILTAWHAEKVTMVQHLLTVPEGSEFQIGDESLVLSAENLAAFKFGVEMAMMQLGTLPFAVEFEEDDAEQQQG